MRRIVAAGRFAEGFGVTVVMRDELFNGTNQVCQRMLRCSTSCRNASLTSAVGCSVWFGRSPSEIPGGLTAELAVHERHQVLRASLVLKSCQAFLLTGNLD